MFHKKKREDTQNRLGTGHLGAIIVLARLPGFMSSGGHMPDPTWQALYRGRSGEPDPSD